MVHDCLLRARWRGFTYGLMFVVSEIFMHSRLSFCLLSSLLLLGTGCPPPEPKVDGRNTLPADTLPSGTLQGRVVIGSDSGDRPAVGARVRLANSAAVVVVGDDGRFQFDAIPAGEYHLMAGLDSDGDGLDELRAAAASVELLDEAGVDVGDLRLEAVSQIQGEVEVSDSTLTVTVVAVGSDSSTRVAVVNRSAFVLSGLAPGNYLVAAGATGYGVVTQSVTVGAGQQASVGRMSLAPVGEERRGVVRASLRLVGQDDHAGIVLARADDPTVSVSSEHSGNVQLELPEGLYVLRASADGYSPAVAPSVLVRNGETTKVGHLLLYPLSGLACNLSDTGGDGDGDGMADADEPNDCLCDPDGFADYNADGVCDAALGDLDGDGVPNARDLCPLTSHLSDQTPQPDGCPHDPQDQTPPTVLSVTPAPDATDVAIDIHPSVTFSEPMLARSFEANTLRLSLDGTPVITTLSVENDTAVLTQAVPLSYDSIYTVTLETGPTDLAGNRLPARQSWSFTTIQEPDLIPPTITARRPAPDSTGVAIDAVVEVVFSEPVLESTLSNGGMTLLQDDTPVPGTVEMLGPTSARFTPTNPLSHETPYTVVIDASVSDLAGNQMGTDDGWSFITVRTGVKQIAAGEHHSCAVKYDGTLWCWGDNSWGQLGIGQGQSGSVPQQVGTDQDWVLVSSKINHSCAIKTDGTLWCWGANESNQVSAVNTDTQYLPVEAPDP